ncbi:argininosuccinate lyase [Terriglobus albidus]|uniref:Argininosuccinate lyase n=1 Tax=Terriglobus albidus TaxID=1592106 RepID=A0A5B9EEC9_9BACT|nr:argininosuccinate lyase [Terriglobus albidus]QEE28647.1 argininosuccinate lyase [Terriglobus albidus]
MESSKSSTFPAVIYRDQVLSHVFQDAKRLFLPAMLEIDYAHVLMLAEQQIISRKTASNCFQGLKALPLQEIAAAKYDGSVEDLFFLVERKLAELCGEEDAGRIHTARSRNDLDMTMYRMVLRGRLLEVAEACLALRSVLLRLAGEYRSALIPAYTHNQPAQPTTMGHYLMAIIEVLERDTERLRAAYAHVNQSPLGACAITGTGFPINRERTAELLGFKGLQINTYGAIAAVDYIIEPCSVLATLMVSLGRFTQEMLLWSTAEFGFLRLSEGYVQVSSIMPQKRNPVPLEHTRILASRAMSESQAVLNSLHNTPFADMNDSEDSLQPLVDLAFADGLRALRLLTGVLEETSFNLERLSARAHGEFLAVTELADTLAREAGLSFHDAHAIVSTAVKASMGRYQPEAMVDFVESALRQRQAKPMERATLLRALDPENFVAVRTTTGGPAPSALNPQIDRARSQFHEDSAWHRSEVDHLSASSQRLHTAVDTFARG